MTSPKRPEVKETWAILPMNEGHGEIPYVVMWIGKHGLPSLLTLATKREAITQFRWLQELGREPAMLLGCEVRRLPRAKVGKK